MFSSDNYDARLNLRVRSGLLDDLTELANAGGVIPAVAAREALALGVRVLSAPQEVQLQVRELLDGPPVPRAPRARPVPAAAAPPRPAVASSGPPPGRRTGDRSWLRESWRGLDDATLWAKGMCMVHSAERSECAHRHGEGAR